MAAWSQAQDKLEETTILELSILCTAAFSINCQTTGYTILTQYPQKQPIPSQTHSKFMLCTC